MGMERVCAVRRFPMILDLIGKGAVTLTAIRLLAPHLTLENYREVLIARALTLFVSDLERTKIAATDRPRPARPANTNSRHIPATVKRAVWQRDGGRCAFTGASGRCSETGFLEYHHVVPFAAGGEASAGTGCDRNSFRNELALERHGALIVVYTHPMTRRLHLRLDESEWRGRRDARIGGRACS